MIHKGEKMERFRVNKEVVRNFDLFGMAPKMFKVMENYINTDARMLDVGTGQGVATRYLASKIKDAPKGLGKVFSIDLSEDLQKMVAEILDEEQAREYVEFQIANVEELPFEDDYFGLIVAMNCLHHFSNPSKAIAEMMRVLKREGTICIVDWSKKAKFLPHKTEDLMELEDFKRLGFNIIEEHTEKLWWFVAIQV